MSRCGECVTLLTWALTATAGPAAAREGCYSWGCFRVSEVRTAARMWLVVVVGLLGHAGAQYSYR